MKKETKWYKSVLPSIAALLVATASLLPIGCGSDKETIQNIGSDTLLTIAQAWAEAYKLVEPKISVEVNGGGSGTGIAALINGTANIANASRSMKPEEKENAEKNTGKTPKELIVGFDAIAVYVHKDNPLNEISLDQLADIYGEEGKIVNWTELGIDAPGGKNEIIRISRQNNSGTYAFFREAVLGKKRDYKLGSRDMHGSKDVVELVGKTIGSIGYSGMGYATEEVKMLKVIGRGDDASAYAPSIVNTLSKKYPISRPLLMYTLGEPTGKIKTYLDWCLSEAGQKIVENNGFVPLPTN